VSKKLYVGNLPYSATEDQITDFFSPITLLSVKLINDRESGRPRGFGFVELENDTTLQSALDLNGTDLSGRKLVINEAKERDPNAPRPQRQQSYTPRSQNRPDFNNQEYPPRTSSRSDSFNKRYSNDSKYNR
jgi:RNA recognition motif-containing protein